MSDRVKALLSELRSADYHSRETAEEIVARLFEKRSLKMYGRYNESMHQLLPIEYQNVDLSISDEVMLIGELRQTLLDGKKDVTAIFALGKASDVSAVEAMRDVVCQVGDTLSDEMRTQTLFSLGRLRHHPEGKRVLNDQKFKMWLENLVLTGDERERTNAKGILSFLF